jgi:hypothetical protein
VRIPVGRYDWSTSPDEWDYQPDQTLKEMGPVRRGLLELMRLAVLASFGVLAWIAL